MNKIVYSLFLICFILCNFPLYASASTLSEETCDAEVKEVVYEVISEVNAAYHREYSGKSINKEGVNFADAYKVYIDYDFFDDTEVTRVELQEKLSTLSEVWCIPVFYEEATVIVEVSRGLPLNEDKVHLMTEEQKQEIMENAGKWTVVRYSLYDGMVDYKNYVEEKLQENTVSKREADYVFLGGVQNAQGVLAAIIENNTVTKIVEMSGAEMPSEIGSEQSISVSGAYSYMEYKEKIAQDVEQNIAFADDDLSGGGMTGTVNSQEDLGLKILLPVIALGTIAVVAFAYWKKQSK